MQLVDNLSIVHYTLAIALSFTILDETYIMSVARSELNSTPYLNRNISYTIIVYLTFT